MKPEGWSDWKQMQEECTRVLGRQAYLPNGEREKCSFHNIQQWKVTKENPWSIFFKYTFQENEEWKELKVRKLSRTPELRGYKMKNAYPEGRAINKKKFLDLVSVVPMLKQHQAKAFYKNLKHDGVMSDIESEVESDSATYRLSLSLSLS
jgi:hypothetical protein